MVRIDGIVLPNNKRIEYALRYVFGVGLKSSQDILRKINISLDKRVKDLTDEEAAAIQKKYQLIMWLKVDCAKRL